MTRGCRDRGTFRLPYEHLTLLPSAMMDLQPLMFCVPVLAQRLLVGSSHCKAVVSATTSLPAPTAPRPCRPSSAPLHTSPTPLPHSARADSSARPRPPILILTMPRWFRSSIAPPTTGQEPKPRPLPTIPPTRPLGIFRGHAIVKDVLADLNASHGLSSATEIMFTGQSAGGLGVFDNVNTIAPLIPSTVRFTAYSDAAFGNVIDNFSPTGTPPNYLDTVDTPNEIAKRVPGIALWNGTGDAGCAAGTNTTAQVGCYSGQQLLAPGGNITLPMLVSISERTQTSPAPMVSRMQISLPATSLRRFRFKEGTPNMRPTIKLFDEMKCPRSYRIRDFLQRHGMSFNGPGLLKMTMQCAMLEFRVRPSSTKIPRPFLTRNLCPASMKFTRPGMFLRSSG